MNKEKNIVFGILFIIIVLSGVFKAMSLSTNKEQNTEIETQQPSSEVLFSEESSEILGDSIEDEKVSITNTSAPTPANQKYVYTDYNNNGLREDSEGPCLYCLARQLVCTDKSAKSFPKAENLILSTLGDRGQFTNDKVVVGSACWGIFEDRKIIIPPSTLELNTKTNNIEIQSIYTTAIISGENMNLRSVTKVEENTYRYDFEIILPALKQKYEDGKSIWIKYLPKDNSLDNYYIQTATIKKDEENNKYYMLVEWKIEEVYESLLNVNSYTIIY